MDRVDLRSDTFTRPTPAMRAVMASADVGDDVWGEDPTVNALQDAAAERFGREAGLFVPSGSMANAIWQLTLADRGTEVLCEADAHVVNYEAGAGALWAGVQYRTVAANRGLLTVDQVAANLRDSSHHDTPTSLVTLEQTHNRHGGSIYPLDDLEAIAGLARERGARVHIDGARIFNAIVAADVPATSYGAVADGLSFCVSKGLGAPVGSLLVGDTDAIAEARSWRRRLGGGMRQAGILAAAGLYALEHHVDRLADDHANARLIAEVIAADVPDAVDVDGVVTNIVYIETGDRDADAVVAAVADDGVLVATMTADLIRLVTHLDVDAAGCRRAAESLVRALTA